MKVNKTYEEMIESIFGDVTLEPFKYTFKQTLLDNPNRHNIRGVKKMYKNKVLSDAGFKVKYYRLRIKEG